ncbi:MAG: antibiotic biosynthesis monooxygenase [Novosphingobium sp.]
MDLEVAILAAKDGDSAGLLKAMADGGTAGLMSCAGCNKVTLLPGIENPGNVLFLIEWDSVEAHAAARGTPGFTKFVEHASPFFGEGGSMQHFKQC